MFQFLKNKRPKHAKSIEDEIFIAPRNGWYTLDIDFNNKITNDSFKVVGVSNNDVEGLY